MGPVRGTLFLFPYGILAFWLGWCWLREKSWRFSLTVGVIIGTLGFLLRVIALSTLVGDNLWVLITRASYSLIEKFIGLLNLPLSPSILRCSFINNFSRNSICFNGTCSCLFSVSKI